MAKTNLKNEDGTLVLYTGSKGEVELRADTDKETIWATQDQISELFETQRPAITKHLKNIFNSHELEENSVSSILEHTAKDGKNYKVKFYNLDAVIAVGYRVNSKKATQFRIWATKTLREYLLKGFALDAKKLQKETGRFEDLREAIAFIESKTRGKVKGKLTLKLTKEIV